MSLFSSTEKESHECAPGESQIDLGRTVSSSNLTGYPTQTVYLNVYDLHEVTSFLAPLGCGLFHAGVEVNGWEYHYGRGESGSGIGQNPPRLCPPHIFREQFVLGVTPLSLYRAEELLEAMQCDPVWDGARCHLVQHNCLHFANAVAEQLLPVSCRVHLQPRPSNAGGERAMHFYARGSTTEESSESPTEGGGGPMPLSAAEVQLPSLIPAHVDRLSRWMAHWVPRSVLAKLDKWDKVGGSECGSGAESLTYEGSPPPS